MKTSTLRAGVVGVGHIGRNHARILSELPGVKFAALLDSDPARAREIASAYGAEPVADLDAFADRIDAASIATPTPAHFPIASALIQRGKHVLIEKPIAENADQARELVALAARHGVILQVGHIERFNPVLSALEQRLDHPRFIEAHRLSPYPNRSTEIGVVLDLMIHDLEIILHLVKSPVASVDAVGIAVLSQREDIANARLRFENGCVANVTASRISPERMRKLRVFQENAYLSLDYGAQSGYIFRLADAGAIESSLLKKLLAGKDSTIVSEFAGRKIVREPVEIEKGEPLKREIEAFLKCCAEGAEPAVSGRQATLALELAVEITRLIDTHAAAIGRPLPASGSTP
jgi:predicted dehydrogenase